jgi:acyl-CoA synthetase (NDP forming)
MNDARSESLRIIEAARPDGWVLEPEAKRLFALEGFDVPRFQLCRTPEEAADFADQIGYPVVAKVVSPRVLHKSDVGGVAVGVADAGRLKDVFGRFAELEGFRGVLVEEMAAGVELILGMKNDVQFGPMILLGMGGTGVEIYRDVVLRMAPLPAKEIPEMIRGLKAYRLLDGYRGAEKVDLERLGNAIAAFSGLVMDLAERIDSIDINPLFCSSRRCVVGDARIVLADR